MLYSSLPNHQPSLWTPKSESEFCVQLFQFSALVSSQLFRVINKWSRNFHSPELNHKCIATQSKLWRNSSIQRREERKGGRRHVPGLNSRRRKRPVSTPGAVAAKGLRRISVAPCGRPPAPPPSPLPGAIAELGRTRRSTMYLTHLLTALARSNGSSLLHHQPRHSPERRRRRRRPTRPFSNDNTR